MHLKEEIGLTRKKLRLAQITPNAIIRENITLNLDTVESANLRERKRALSILPARHID